MAVSSTIGPTATRPLVPGWAWWLLALAGAVLTALLTLRSLSYAATFVAVAAVTCTYLRSRFAGLALMWALWLVLPGLRRVLGLSEGFANADPLAVVPFAAIAIIGALELRQARLSRRATVVVFCALGGIAFGVPAGLYRDPLAAAFALFAYSAAVLGFAAGYREPADRELSLVRVLVAAAIPLSLYGILQIVAPLMPWDDAWLKSVDFVSIGSKEGGDLRAFSTLNSTFALAFVLGVTILSGLSVRRFGPFQMVVLLVSLACLALTLVRAVWLALALVLLILLLTMPRRVGARVLVVGAVTVVAFPAMAGGTNLAQAVTERVTTLGELETDTSAQARIATPSQIVPLLVRQPLGVGLGSAGEASRLASSGGFRATDSGILSILFQSGAVGLVLVLSAVTLGLRSAVRNARARRSSQDITVLAGLLLLGILLFASDVFYGVAGAVLWYLIGVAVRRDQRPTAPSAP